MTISLVKASSKDAEELHVMQIKSFLPLLEKYKDYETNPACESLEKTLDRINNPHKGFFKILRDNITVGGISIKHIATDVIFLGPIFVDPSFQNEKICQKALTIIEKMFPSIGSFELATIAQEKGNIHLYKKMGYVIHGDNKKINDSMEIIYFRKIITHSDKKTQANAAEFGKLKDS